MIPIRCEVEEFGSPTQVRNRLNEILREAWRTVAEVWWRRILPRHFAFSASAEYGYEKRTRRYMLRKARTQHHQVPLVWTGRLRRSVLRNAAIAATRKGATVRLAGPVYFGATRRRRRGPDIGAEATAVSDRDQRDLDRYVDQAVMHEIDRVRDRVRRRISEKARDAVTGRFVRKS